MEGVREMAFWKKVKDESAQETSDKSEPDELKPDEPYDILNDFPRLKKNLNFRDNYTLDSRRDSPTVVKYLIQSYRQNNWATGAHFPLPYLVEVEPPYLYLSTWDMAEVESLPALHARRCPERDLRYLTCFTIAMSPNDNITASQAEQFWLSLRNISEPVSFEIVANCEEMIFQFLCHLRDSQYIASQLAAYCPEAEINPEGTDPDYLTEWLSLFVHRFKSNIIALPCELCLAKPYHQPLRTFTNFNPDPLSVLVDTLGDLEEDEGAVFQALVTPTKNDWKRPLLETYFADELYRDLLFYVTEKDSQMTREKLQSYPFFAVVSRLMAFGNTSTGLMHRLIRSFDQYTSEYSNLFALDVEEYPDCVNSFFSETLTDDIVKRQTHRSGMLLNPKELAGICHFPAKSLQHPKLFRATHATAKAPEIALREGITIGINEVHGKRREVSIPESRRDLHTYIVGATGTGKSTLLLNMIVQDMDNGEGVCVIDPHGDLISDILWRIPEGRIDDVILFDPADVEYPIGLNLLSASNFRETDLVCSDLLAVLERMFDAASWGENIEQILRMCIFCNSERY
jgi:hypothetical protein